jgi:hypothetical protein
MHAETFPNGMKGFLNNIWGRRSGITKPERYCDRYQVHEIIEQTRFFAKTRSTFVVNQEFPENCAPLSEKDTISWQSAKVLRDIDLPIEGNSGNEIQESFGQFEPDNKGIEKPSTVCYHRLHLKISLEMKSKDKSNV